MYIYIHKSLNETTKNNFHNNFNPIECIQCAEFSTTPAVFISGTTSVVNTAGVVENSGHCMHSIDQCVFDIAFRRFI